jgi:hypothetical protein
MTAANPAASRQAVVEAALVLLERMGHASAARSGSRRCAARLPALPASRAGITAPSAVMTEATTHLGGTRGSRRRRAEAIDMHASARTRARRSRRGCQV